MSQSMPRESSPMGLQGILQIWGVSYFWWLNNLRLIITAMFTDQSFAQDTSLGLHLYEHSMEMPPVKKLEKA